MKETKRGIIGIVAGIIAIVIGAAFQAMVENMNPYGMSSNMRDIAKFLPFFFIILGVFCLGANLLLMIMNKANEGKPIVTKRGQVLEKQKSGPYDMLTIHFEDGTRKTILAKQDVILTVGDKGVIKMQGNWVVGFAQN